MTTLIFFAPLVGALLCGFGHKFFGEKAATWIATGLLFFACALSWIVFLSFDGEQRTVNILRVPQRPLRMPQISAVTPDTRLVTITTDYPDSIPFRAFAQDAAARR